MEEKKLTYGLICAAVRGEPQAQEEILKYYDEYMNSLAMVEDEAENGEKIRYMAQKVFSTIFDNKEETIMAAETPLGKEISELKQTDILKDKVSIEKMLQFEQKRYDTLLEMRMNNEIPKEVFYRKQIEVEGKIAELEEEWDGKQ